MTAVLKQIRHEWRQGDRATAVLIYCMVTCVMFGATTGVVALIIFALEHALYATALAVVVSLAVAIFWDIVR